MITISEQFKVQLFDIVRQKEKERCEDVIRQQYYFVDELDPYEVNEQLGETVELLTANCLDVVGVMLERLEKDGDILEGNLGIQKNDTLTNVQFLDVFCSIFALEYASGARVVYKDTPSGPYELWEYATSMAGICGMKTICRGDYLYSEYIERSPLKENQTPSEYFQNLGKLFALIHIFGGGDLHVGNLYVVGNMPVVIDCDMVLHLGEPYWRIAASGCLPYDDGGEYKKFAQESTFFYGAGCPRMEDETFFRFEDYVEDIKRGYKDCVKHVIPQMHDGFMRIAQGIRYRYLPMKEELARKLFRQRIVFGFHESSSESAIIQGIMESINQLKQPKFYVEIDDKILYYGNVPIGEANAITTELLENRFMMAQTSEDIAIQFEDIDNAAKMFREAREQDKSGV